MKQILVTAAVIEGETGSFLMAQRLPEGAEGGKWEFPGGKVESGEEPRVSIARELAEELNLTISAGPILDVVSVVTAERQLVLLYFRAAITRGEPKPLQCQDVAWFTPAAIDALDKPTADRIFWERYRTVISITDN